jgi:murein DD-endopeptidase MepM/ murein hydrolase activator NlpD
MDAPKPDIFKPTKPHIVNQPWGTFAPSTYSQFGFTRHNGLDLALAPDRKIYAPFDGQIIRVATKQNGQWQPNGGGVFVSLLSEPLAFPAFKSTAPNSVIFDFAAGTYRILVDFLHCESISVPEGLYVKAGDLLAIGDNTGFSTGPHCHTQWRREMDHALPAPAGVQAYRFLNNGFWLEDADRNEANSSFDPTQFFNGFYAQDAQTAVGLLTQLGHLLQMELAELTAKLKKTN